MKKSDSIFVKSKLKKMIKDSGASISTEAFNRMERDLTTIAKCQIAQADKFAKHRKVKRIGKQDVEMAKSHSGKCLS